jgi:prevent-host-death family protein
MKSYSVTEARDQLPSLIDLCSKERIVITRHGKEVAVLVAPSLYEEMIEALEDLEDIKLIDESRAEGGKSIPWEQVKKELGW